MEKISMVGRYDYVPVGKEPFIEVGKIIVKFIEKLSFSTSLDGEIVRGEKGNRTAMLVFSSIGMRGGFIPVMISERDRDIYVDIITSAYSRTSEKSKFTYEFEEELAKIGFEIVTEIKKDFD